MPVPVFLAVEIGEDDVAHLFSSAPREAPTTRGFAGILHAGLDGLGADEVLAIPAELISRLGLQDLVSPLRMRGMSAMLARIKRQLREKRAGERPASVLPAPRCFRVVITLEGQRVLESVAEGEAWELAGLLGSADEADLALLRAAIPLLGRLADVAMRQQEQASHLM